MQRIIIKHQYLEDIHQQIKKYYSIGRVRWKKSNSKHEFLEPPNSVNRTFVIYQYISTDWVEIEMMLGNLFEIDEILRRITDEYNTIAFIGYYSNYNGDFRFALFEKGLMLRSILILYDNNRNERRLVHNFGKKLPFETIDFGTPITCELPDEQLLDYEVFSKWGTELGLIMEERENVDYLHLEVIDFKN